MNAELHIAYNYSAILGIVNNKLLIGRRLSSNLVWYI